VALYDPISLSSVARRSEFFDYSKRSLEVSLKRFIPSVVALALSATIASPAAAAPLQKTGRISEIFLSGPYNYAFRIFLDSGLPSCAGNFAYMNIDSGNYQAYASALMTAYSTNKTVDLTYQIDATGGTCTILEFAVH
jgi:hypothetical protein